MMAYGTSGLPGSAIPGLQRAGAVGMNSNWYTSGGGGGRAKTGSSAASQSASLIASMKAAQDKANAANESRYQSILSGYKSRRGNLGAMYTGDRADAKNRHTAQASATEQSMISRGLGNTTASNTAQRVAYRDYEHQLQRINQDEARMASGLHEDQLRFMERRTDAHPNLGMYSSLLSGLGSGSGGMGYRFGGGGGGGGPREEEEEEKRKEREPPYDPNKNGLGNKLKPAGGGGLGWLGQAGRYISRQAASAKGKADVARNLALNPQPQYVNPTVNPQPQYVNPTVIGPAVDLRPKLETDPRAMGKKSAWWNATGHAQQLARLAKPRTRSSSGGYTSRVDY